jgi:hypothetical protein
MQATDWALNFNCKWEIFYDSEIHSYDIYPISTFPFDLQW